MGDIGKKDFFEKVYDEMADPIYRHCFFRVNNKETAEDLVSEIFLRFWREIEKGTVINDPKSWLYHIARNAIIDYYRKKKSDSLDSKMEDGFEASNPEDSENIEINAEISLVMKRIENLSSDEKEIIIMRFMDGLEVKEIAKIIGKSPNATSVVIHRAIEKIKK